MQKSDQKPAVFLDRDGTINVEKEYLYKVEDFEFIPRVPEAIRALKRAGYLVVVVTNQSGVARGYFGVDDVERLHDSIQEQLRQTGTAVDGFYLCPHHPEKGTGDFLKACQCRKGRPGMLLQAAADLNIDLQNSFMIGDKVADIEAGENAGCQSLLVLTGYGKDSLQQLSTGRVSAFDDLSAAVDYILESNKVK